MIRRYYRKPDFGHTTLIRNVRSAEELLGMTLGPIAIEYCFYAVASDDFDAAQEAKLWWLLQETFAPQNTGTRSFLADAKTVVEVGPRLNFETAFSSAAVAICQSCGISSVKRLERSTRFGLTVELTEKQKDIFAAPLHDRMTQMRYMTPLENFESRLAVQPVRIITVLEEGIPALRRINQELGLGMDDQDFEMYYDLCVHDLKRNPTDAELFHWGNANSEHSRHHFFKGLLIIDGKPCEGSLMDLVKLPWKKNPGNSILAFCDDSSAIRGNEILDFLPQTPGEPSSFQTLKRILHPTLTAETHNFPSGVAPFPGAETGTGGRIRDNQAVGRGGAVIAAGAAYCVGNLHIPGYTLPWEEDGWQHPANLASPLEILIQASNGASDYGNKFGEPVIYGFTRSCGMELPNGYRSWYKPIMYTVGAGQLADEHVYKQEPEVGMLVVQIGGPAYRIGMGGGAASSMTQGENKAELDFNAVQRGDAQMEQRVHRFIRACTALGVDNPIISIHDLGAGGDCNALPEIVHPAGAVINLRNLPVGDITLSVLEIWGNESQERHALLARPSSVDRMRQIAEREHVPFAIVGSITGDGQLRVYDAQDNTTPVDFPLDKVLGNIPRKTFHSEALKSEATPLVFNKGLTLRQALDRVLRLPSVASKRFLTTKVDRSVTGLIAQQQCVGPHQITLSDFAAITQGYFGHEGVALSLGEQPIKGLLSPKAAARMAVAEALLNMAGAKITDIRDIKCSANWMLAAKIGDGGTWLREAAEALSEICIELGIAIDGGKDSLSMSVKTKAPDGSDATVRAPGELVIAMYAPMPDVQKKATPDFKQEGNTIILVDLSCGKMRLGGSALAQVFCQIGEDPADVDDATLLARAFAAVQKLVADGVVCSVHDRSDGGLITTLLEMGFAGCRGMDIDLPWFGNEFATFFNEEAGFVLETDRPEEVLRAFANVNVPAFNIGIVEGMGGDVTLKTCGSLAFFDNILRLRSIWEETSGKLDALQANPDCVAAEKAVVAKLSKVPPYKLTFEPKPSAEGTLGARIKPKVAIIREQGTNGDREMAAAFYMAGFEVWDITMSDLAGKRITLDQFRGVVFPGGFAYADVLDAGKGWAGAIRLNETVSRQFDAFHDRGDTFSLGVCNGCQLMALLGWAHNVHDPDELKPRFVRNVSERFESRFATVKIFQSPSIMLQGMERSQLGIWVAHREGRLHGHQAIIQELIESYDLAPIRYIDFDEKTTEQYPFNPNGTPGGIAGICSPDGRHLALMPHPERTFRMIHWPWVPSSWKNIHTSPWLRMFQNAYEWCIRTPK